MNRTCVGKRKWPRRRRLLSGCVCCIFFRFKSQNCGIEEVSFTTDDDDDDDELNWTCCAKQFWDCIALKIHRYATIASASHAKSMFYNNKIIDNYYSDIFIITLVINGTQFLICDYCLVNWIIYNNFYLSVVFFFVHSYAHMQMALQQLISPIMNGVWVCSQSDDDKMLAWMCITNAEKEMKISPLFASRR